LLSLLLPQNVSAERAIKEEGGKEEEGEEKKEKGTKQNKKKKWDTNGRTDGRARTHECGRGGCVAVCIVARVHVLLCPALVGERMMHGAPHSQL
jgi:hypothetical protein